MIAVGMFSHELVCASLIIYAANFECCAVGAFEMCQMVYPRLVSDT